MYIHSYASLLLSCALFGEVQTATLDLSSDNRADEIGQVLAQVAAAKLEHLPDRRVVNRNHDATGVLLEEDEHFGALITQLQDYSAYFSWYRIVQSQIEDAFDHAFTVDSGYSPYLTEQIVLGMGGNYTPSQTLLLATLPDSSGQSTLFGSDGGAATASSLVLLPRTNTVLPPPAYSPPTYTYSATMTNGSQHSGVAWQDVKSTPPLLVLLPDAIYGTAIFSPADMSLLRWALYEIPGLDAGDLLGLVVPPFAPPVSGGWIPGGFNLRQEEPFWTAIIICCQQAINQWKDEMMDAANDHQTRLESIERESGHTSKNLEDEIAGELGRSVASAIMTGGFLSMGQAQNLGMTQAELDLAAGPWENLKNIHDANKQQAETGSQNEFDGRLAAANAALNTKLTACMTGWPNAVQAANLVAAMMADPLALAQ